MASTIVRHEMMELDKIQGLVARGYGGMSAASFWLLQIQDPTQARAWLQSVLPKISPASKKPLESSLHLAFTFPGLIALGLDVKQSAHFSSEFIQGMANEYRARILGDLGESSASNWEWGGDNNPAVHLLLLLYGRNSGVLAAEATSLKATLASGGLILVRELETASNPMSREHFGFRDGISQPVLAALKKEASPGNPQAPDGEFVLGYPNAYKELPDTPMVPESWDSGTHLPDASVSGMKDLGKNGTYLVFRQLKQDVVGFWKFLLEAVRKENASAGGSEAVQLAAKMVGRWPSGAPITLCPVQDDASMAQENDFLYHESDGKGFNCPAGSHVRRANPRDALQGSKPATAQKISQRHRILRRGRNFGPPLVADFEPTAMLNAADDGQVRGLHFICLNTNIARQFEFIQHSWSDNTKFEGLYDDPDPILGIKDTRNKAETHDFTIPQLPVRRKVQGLQRFVHVLGGAYFFLPSLPAIAFLAALKPVED